MADAERLRRLAYLMLAPGLGRRRRVTLATAAAERAEQAADPIAALVAEVLHTAGGRVGLAAFGHGLRRNAAGAEATRELAGLYPAARVAYVLAHLARRSAAHTADILRAAGVADPETAVEVAEKAQINAADLARIEVPDTAGPAVSRLVVGGVVAGALAIAAPVIAVTTHGGSHPTDTAHPVDSSLARPLDKSLVPPAGKPHSPAKPPATATPDTAHQLKALLAQLDRKLATDHDKAHRDVLVALRAAVAERLAKLPR
jgi:hypothetical protein